MATHEDVSPLAFSGRIAAAGCPVKRSVNESDESGMGRDESGTSRDESATAGTNQRREPVAHARFRVSATLFLSITGMGLTESSAARESSGSPL